MTPRWRKLLPWKASLPARPFASHCLRRSGNGRLATPAWPPAPAGEGKVKPIMGGCHDHHCYTIARIGIRGTFGGADRVPIARCQLPRRRQPRRHPGRKAGPITRRLPRSRRSRRRRQTAPRQTETAGQLQYRSPCRRSRQRTVVADFRQRHRLRQFPPVGEGVCSRREGWQARGSNDRHRHEFAKRDRVAQLLSSPGTFPLSLARGGDVRPLPRVRSRRDPDHRRIRPRFLHDPNDRRLHPSLDQCPQARLRPSRRHAAEKPA